MNDTYKRIAVYEIPRILGFGDRNPESKTFGCFDRNYWHYKLVDFPNSRFQESALLLALLYKKIFKGNIYFNNKKILDWVGGVIQFWSKIQHRDGSFDEVYPNERSFCATSFSTFAVSETLLLLGEREGLRSVEMAGRWLSKNNNELVSNQMAASAVALHNVYMLTGDEEFKKEAENKIALLVRNQSRDGFYPEYLGYDIGYLSLTLGLLCRYYLKTGKKSVFDSIKAGLKFIEKHVKDNGSFDYLKTSRKTQFLYPYAFFMLKSEVCRRIDSGLMNNEIVNPSWLDDRYVIQLTTDYLQL